MTKLEIVTGTSYFTGGPMVALAIDGQTTAKAADQVFTRGRLRTVTPVRNGQTADEAADRFADSWRTHIERYYPELQLEVTRPKRLRDVGTV